MKRLLRRLIVRLFPTVFCRRCEHATMFSTWDGGYCCLNCDGGDHLFF